MKPCLCLYKVITFPYPFGWLEAHIYRERGDRGDKDSGTMEPEGRYPVQHFANLVEPGTKNRGTSAKPI